MARKRTAATPKVDGYFEARYGLRRAMIAACGLATGCCSQEKRKCRNVARRDKPKTPLKRRHSGADVQDGASAAICNFSLDEDQVDTSAEKSLVSAVVFEGRKRRILQGKTTNEVHASQDDKKPSAVLEASASTTMRQQAEQPSVVLARKVHQLRKGCPTASGEAAKVLPEGTRATRATPEKRRELDQRVRLRKQREANRREENCRRQVVRESPAPAKHGACSESKTLVAKKAAVSRTRSASNKKASKDQVSASSDVFGPGEPYCSLDVPRDGVPFCGPVVFAPLLPPSAVVEGGRQCLLGCDSTDPQGILTTSVTVTGCSEVPCALTQETSSRGTGKMISEKPQQPIFAMETPLIEHSVVGSGDVRRSCAFDREDRKLDGNACVVFSSYCEDVHTAEHRACRRDVCLELTEEDCRPTAVPLISPTRSADGGSDLAAATRSLPAPDDRTNPLRARELSAAVSKHASATSASIGLPDFAQSEAPDSSANAATIAEFHCGQKGTMTSRRIREETDAADGIARPHEPVFGLVSSPQKDCQSSLISFDDGSSIAADDKCALSQGGSEDGDAIFGAERVSSGARKRAGDVQVASGIVPGQDTRPTSLGLLVGPEKYSSRNCPADENMTLELCADSNVPAPEGVASSLVQSAEDEQCNEQRRQCWDVMRNNISPEPSRGGGDEMNTQTKILLSFQRASVDKHTSDTEPESPLLYQQRNSVNGENGIELFASPSAERRQSGYRDIFCEYEKIPNERSHSPYDTSEPSLHAADRALLEPGNSVACLERRLADGDRRGVCPEYQKVTYLQRQSRHTNLNLIGESENNTSLGRSCATDGWLDRSERLPSQRRQSVHVGVPATTYENGTSRQRWCDGDDLLLESMVLDSPKITTSEQGVQVERQTYPHEPMESPVPIPDSFPLQQRLSRLPDHRIFVSAESEESAAARTQLADEEIDDLENYLTQRTWRGSSLVSALESLPSLRRRSALEERLVAESDNLSSGLGQSVDNPSSASEEFLRLRRNEGIDGTVVQSQCSLRLQTQPDSNDTFPSQPADEGPVSQRQDIPSSESRYTDDSAPFEAIQPERLPSFSVKYNAIGGRVSERFSSLQRGPDTRKSVFQQTQCAREEPLPAAQTENLPCERTHADDDVLVVSEKFPVWFGRSAAFSERTNNARMLKAHRRDHRQTVPLRYVHYPPLVESERPASLRRRRAVDTLALESIPCQYRASASDEPSAVSDGAACFQNQSADEDLIIVSELFPLSWNGSGADDDDDDVIIESWDSDSGRGESSSDLSETFSSFERRWSGHYDVPALFGGHTSWPIRPFHRGCSGMTPGSSGQVTAHSEQEAASTPGERTNAYDLTECVRAGLLSLNVKTAVYVLRVCREEEAERRVLRLYSECQRSQSSEACAAQIRGILQSAIERKSQQWKRIKTSLRAIGNLGGQFPDPRDCGERPLTDLQHLTRSFEN
nr:uncharacterized protein LOC129385627 [Dermacentor andersoni]